MIISLSIHTRASRIYSLSLTDGGALNVYQTRNQIMTW